MTEIKCKICKKSIKEDSALLYIGSKKFLCALCIKKKGEKECIICKEKTTKKCNACNRPFCFKHLIPDHSYSEDYPDYFCQECNNARAHIIRLEEKHDDKISRLYKEWRHNCKEVGIKWKEAEYDD